MTDQDNSDQNNSENYLTLQRGGAEMLLMRVRDRFTTRLTMPDAVELLRPVIEPLSVRPVARGELVEWRVATTRLEDCLTAARSHEWVQFASRVYQPVSSPKTWLYLTDQMTVQFAPTVTVATGRSLTQQYGLSESHALTGIPNAFVYLVTRQATENPIKIANRLIGLPEVLAAEPNVVVEAEQLYRPQDELFGQQWHLTSTMGSNIRPDAHISVEQAWDLTRGSRSIVIAVSDDGFDLDHPDLQGTGKIVAPMDLKARDAVPLPTAADENHGTSCAGLAIAEENQTGVVGVAPGCGFMPIRTTGFLDDESVERIFQWAVQKGAAVISCSWSPASVNFPLSIRQSNALTQAATTGRGGKGCVVVFSAGNANRPVSGTVNERGWPSNALRGPTEWLSGFAIHPDVIAVSACTSLNTKSAYSSWGKHISVAAPSNNAHPAAALPELGSVKTGPIIASRIVGRGMVTSDRTGAAGYNRDAYTNTFGGTSSSCPVVAGVAGLVLSANPNLTARDVKQILQQTADKVVDSDPDPQLGLRHGTYDNNGHSQWFGYGRVNAFKAVQEAKRRLWQGRSYRNTVDLKDTAAVLIPDNQVEGAVRSLLCNEQGVVQDISVEVKLEHTFLGDVMVLLQPPGGREVLLQGRSLGQQQTLDQRYDLSNTPVLMRVIDAAARGRWRLRVSDRAAGHTGRLLGWRLVLALR
ncbi:S8 family serine peptidase [Oscillatoria sp. CS-180]|uniref:S8 family serine peptidase n=1 Tax=Oscillatoria sp. CS-180 TaxID=3021720 RepID=UPI0023305398|nr:S8 family serine peptidase [Oscillatoria sp. CS-180]MDB9525368.1 S8 family serine peptidase [Oscillatoria sp. CS-180]